MSSCEINIAPFFARARHARRGLVKTPLHGLLRVPLATCVTAVALLAGCGPGRPLSETGPVPPAVEPPAKAEIDAAMRRGIAFLIAHQNADGSWGSARNTKGLNVYAPVPGAHMAFRAGVSALAVMALCQTLDRVAPDQSAAARSALPRSRGTVVRRRAFF